MKQATLPRIGVTGPDRGGVAAWWCTWLAVRRAGGRALRITPSRPRSIRELDGVVIGGGADVAESLPSATEPITTVAAHSNRRQWWSLVASLLVAPVLLLLRWVAARRHPMSGDPARDRLESTMLRVAWDEDLPTLGICRGAQLMAVVGGGSLLREVGTHHEERADLWTVFPRRRVRIESNTTLRAVMGTQEVMANSLHRDAVACVIPPVVVAAREQESSVVQGIEDPTRRFWVGVQWHPEYMPQLEMHQRIFRGLVRAARAGRSDVRPRGTDRARTLT